MSCAGLLLAGLWGHEQQQLAVWSDVNEGTALRTRLQGPCREWLLSGQQCTQLSTRLQHLQLEWWQVQLVSGTHHCEAMSRHVILDQSDDPIRVPWSSACNAAVQ